MIYSEPLQYFVEVIRCGSFSRAAKKLGLATSTVTKTITALEHDLDKVLVKRLKSGVELTDVGRELYESIVDSFMNIENAVDRVKNNGEDYRKTLKIMTTTGVASIWLMSRLKSFIEEYPDIKISIETTSSSIALSKVDADIAILPSVDDPGLVIGKKVHTMKTRLVASPEYIKKFGMPKSREDLVNHRIIGFYHAKKTFNGNVDWHLKTDSGVLEPNLIVNSAICMFYATILGYGLSTIGSDFSVDHDLIEVLPDVPPQSVDIFFFTPKKRAGEKIIDALFMSLASEESCVNRSSFRILS